MENKNIYIIGGLVVGLLVLVAVFMVTKKRKDAQKQRADELKNQISQGATDPASQAVMNANADTNYDASADVARLNKAKGGMFWNDDEEAVYATLRGKTKGQLKVIYSTFQTNYGEPLMSFLTNFMDAAEMAKVSQIVNGAK